MGREALGLSLLGLAVLLLTALVTFHPLDPLWGSGEGEQVHNWAGKVGAAAAWLLAGGLGLASLWLPAIFGWWGAKFLRRRYQEPPLATILGLALLIPSSAGLICLLQPTFTWNLEPLESGGKIGAILVFLLRDQLKTLGAVVVLIVLVLVGLMLSLDLSLAAMVEAARDGGGSFLSRLGTAKIRLRERKERAKSEKYQRLKEALERQAPQIIIDEPAVDEPPPAEPVQQALPFMAELGLHEPPSLALLDEPPQDRFRLDPKSLEVTARLLEKKLFDFGVEGEVVEVNGGPVITMYEYKPAPGVKIAKIVALADDLSLSLRSSAIRVVGPLPGKGTMGVEIPNAHREMVYLKELLAGQAFREAKAPLTLALGKDTVGRPYVADLARMPHLLIAGATGSGKSVCLNTMLMSILFRTRPAEVRMLMVDPKRIELSAYDGIPHLLHPVLTDPQAATKALRWAVAEMEARYELLAQAGVRSIESYNVRAAKGETPPRPGAEELGPAGPLPYIVIVIDELADLMMVASREVEACLIRLAQMARAAGLHLVLATQRPSVDVITGIIKANFPARIAFQVASKIDSRTILDANGAESLLGAGDMLFLPPGVGKLTRLHGAYVSEAEVQRVADFLRNQGRPEYNDQITAGADAEDGASPAAGERDELYQAAVEVVMEAGKASISMVQRKLRVGYNRAARMIEMMAAEGLVSEPDHTNTRRVVGGGREEMGR